MWERWSASVGQIPSLWLSTATQLTNDARTSWLFPDEIHEWPRETDPWNGICRQQRRQRHQPCWERQDRPGMGYVTYRPSLTSGVYPAQLYSGYYLKETWVCFFFLLLFLHLPPGAPRSFSHLHLILSSSAASSVTSMIRVCTNYIFKRRLSNQSVIVRK